MRVITGIAKGRKLATPEGLDVRPTSQRVKEGIFSAIQFDIEGRRVLDLFSGSGQLGIEALSRGAISAVFVDNSTASIEITKQNLKTTKFEGVSQLVKSDYDMFLKGNKEKFDIAFIDPPYNAKITDKVINELTAHMSDYGIIICEHSIDEKLNDSYNNFILKKDYKYGKKIVSIFRTV